MGNPRKADLEATKFIREIDQEISRLQRVPEPEIELRHGADMYRKVILEAVVHEDDCEGMIQQLGEDLERLQKHTTLYRAEIRDEQAATPENAEEIAAP